MPDYQENQDPGVKMNTSHRRFEVTVYIGGLKIIGVAYFAADTRSSSRRASDYIYALREDKVTLSSARIYERTTGLVIDEPPFVVLTLARIDAIHAEEVEGTTPA